MSKMNRRQLFLSSAKGALAAALGAVGFRTAAHAQSPTAVEFPDSKVLPTPTPPFKGFIEPNLVNSMPGWPPTIMPPEGAPNVLLVRRRVQRATRICFPDPADKIGRFGLDWLIHALA